MGASNRVIAYYEQDGAQPPGAILVELAHALKVSSHELLGVKPLKEKASPKTVRLLKRLQRIEQLPPADQHPGSAGMLMDAVTILETGDQTMRAKTAKGFGARLAQLRQQRGLSQEALAAVVGVSRRVIAYYEAESDQPPGALLADLAQALTVSADELLGLKPIAEKLPRKTARLRKRLQQVEALPPADQRAVLKVLDALVEAHRRNGRK